MTSVSQLNGTRVFVRAGKSVSEGRRMMNSKRSICRAAVLICAFGAPVVTAAQTQSPPAKAPTFTKDVAPIFQRSCQLCHRPDSIAPMSLLTYEDARPWAKAMKLRTGLRSRPETMPPWFIEKNIGIQQFKDDYSLSDREVTAIAKWADSGA